MRIAAAGRPARSARATTSAGRAAPAPAAGLGNRPTGPARPPAPRARGRSESRCANQGRPITLALAEPGEDGRRADLVPERVIGGHRPGADQMGEHQPGQRLFHGSRASHRRGCAHSRAGASGLRRAGLSCREEAWVTGPPWPFAGISSDARTSGGDHVRRTRVRAGTAPEDVLSPQGFSLKLVPGSTRQGLI